MISKATSFFICFLMSILCFLGLFSLAWADSLEELKKALQGNDVEAAWKAVDGMTQKTFPATEGRDGKYPPVGSKKGMGSLCRDIRQSIAIQLAAMKAKEPIPDLLQLIREKKNIDHECAE